MTKGEKTRSIPITQEMVRKAYEQVRRKGGSGGVDRISIAAFESDLEKQLYKIWNRLSSGSYFPPSVREVSIPKKDGSKRKLGIPTVGDRVAQQVLKSYVEPRLESIFVETSYGYRPLRSAHDAIGKVAENVRSYAWVIDMDIKRFFDEVDHEKLLQGLSRHVEERWVLMYVRRWLEAPVLEPSGHERIKSGQGTPQGGVISPLLANLFLHYAFDQWMLHYYADVPFVRYADDVIIHCRSKEQAQGLLTSVRDRLASCKLRLHEDKTRIVYCKDYRRHEQWGEHKFEFLGFSFQPRSSKSKSGGGMFLGYSCALSNSSKQKILSELRRTNFHRWSNITLEALSKRLNRKLSGWVNYFGRFGRRELLKVLRVFHRRLLKWVLQRYKNLKGSVKRGYTYLKQLQRGNRELFYHWKKGYLTL